MKRFLSCLTLLLVAACHRGSDQAQVHKPLARAKAPVAVQPGVQELTAGMVEAASQGKSQAPVALKFDLAQRPVQGEPLEVIIALLPQIAASPATIDVSAPEGLKLADGDGRIEFPSVDAAQVYRHTIKLTPMAEGVFVLNFAVSLKHDQLTDSRTFSVPIIVAASPGGGAKQASSQS